MSSTYGDVNSLLGKFYRAEAGMNYALSVFGSFLYLLGSIMLIPALNELVEGTWVYVYGSLVLMASQLWKMKRSGYNNIEDVTDKVFRWDNYRKDYLNSCVNVCTFMGAFGYLWGSVYFLPMYDTSTEQTRNAAGWFILGGVFYTIGSCFYGYRYFYTENVLFVEDDESKRDYHRRSLSIHSRV